MKKTFEYLNQKFEYSIKYTDRKNLKIKVSPDKKISVEAPINSDINRIYEKINKRKKWIYKQVLFFDKFHPLTTPRKYINGETHYYLGKQYRLKIVKSNINNVKLSQGYLIVNTTNNDLIDNIKDLLDKWYLEHAKILFNKYLNKILKNENLKNFVPNQIIIRKMFKRWGSCTKDGKIILNLELIKAPGLCIQYVILHEICHLKYEKHNDEFNIFLNKLMPDWKRWKEKLELFMS